MSTVLELRGVTKSYGDNQVLRGIDLAVGEHEAIALIGASGSGKSTLLRCIDLLEEIDDGDILLDGEPITLPGRAPCPPTATGSRPSSWARSGPRGCREPRRCPPERRCWPGSGWPGAAA